jgi:hypothetical protein
MSERFASHDGVCSIWHSHVFMAFVVRGIQFARHAVELDYWLHAALYGVAKILSASYKRAVSAADVLLHV